MKTKSTSRRIDSQAFTLIMARFDRLEEQNNQQTQLLENHKIEDEKVHEIVTKHQTYFTLVKWLVGPTGVAAIIGSWFYSK